MKHGGDKNAAVEVDCRGKTKTNNWESVPSEMNLGIFKEKP